MAVAFQAVGADVAATTATLSLVAPAALDNDIFIAHIMSNDNTVITLPQGWTLINGLNNTSAMRQTSAWHRASNESGATFVFGGFGGVLLEYGVILSYRGARIVGSPIAAGPSTSANVSADSVTYATYTPKSGNGLLIALGSYNLNATTAGAMSGTNPTFTTRLDVETPTGNTASLFAFDGPSSQNLATGSRTHTTTSTTDAINNGVVFELLDPDYTGDLSSGGGAPGQGVVKYPAIGRNRGALPY